MATMLFIAKAVCLSAQMLSFGQNILASLQSSSHQLSQLQFSNYYVSPAPKTEPQLALYDEVLNITYPVNLMDPKTLPTANTDPVYCPPGLGLANTTFEALVQLALSEIKSIIHHVGGLSGNCSKCIAALSVEWFPRPPEYVTDTIVSLFQSAELASNASCTSTSTAGSYGAI